MILTKKQEIGLHTAIDRYKNKEKYTVISGFAGTGKSTLVKFIISELRIAPSKICYATYTGKAAQVLMNKGNKNVRTLHKLLYKSTLMPDGKFIKVRKSSLEYEIVVVDEISMVPKTLIDLLFSYDVHVICLGDPFQLPPPSNNSEDNGLLRKPHVFLDEIMRQAEGSEIIQLSMKVRKGEPIGTMQGKEVLIYPREALNTTMLKWADQILVATNATRNSINNQMRQLLGRGDKPENGDKIICLENDWDILSSNGDPLVNGTIGYISNERLRIFNVPRYFQTKRNTSEILINDFVTEESGIYQDLRADNQMILTGEPQFDWKERYMLGRTKNGEQLISKQFAYGYAITCHKAQGSEFDKVLVIEEKFPFNKTEHARWLYTAVTRAIDKLVLIQKG